MSQQMQLTVLALCAALAAGCSDTEDPATILPPFADLDTDDDGALSPREAEAIPELADVFEIADVNQDGQLSLAEFSHATLEGTRVSVEAAGGPQFGALDTDGSGAIGADEAEAVPALARDFESFDDNGDGLLSLAEYQAAREAGLEPE